MRLLDCSQIAKLLQLETVKDDRFWVS